MGRRPTVTQGYQPKLPVVPTSDFFLVRSSPLPVPRRSPHVSHPGARQWRPVTRVDTRGGRCVDLERDDNGYRTHRNPKVEVGRLLCNTRT